MPQELATKPPRRLVRTRNGSARRTRTTSGDSGQIASDAISAIVSIMLSVSKKPAHKASASGTGTSPRTPSPGKKPAAQLASVRVHIKV